LLLGSNESQQVPCDPLFAKQCQDPWDWAIAGLGLRGVGTTNSPQQQQKPLSQHTNRIFFSLVLPIDAGTN
jgi:hypothetical protein